MKKCVYVQSSNALAACIVQPDKANLCKGLKVPLYIISSADLVPHNMEINNTYIKKYIFCSCLCVS